MDSHSELKSYRSIGIISHWYLIYFKCKQYNCSPNKEKIDLQLVVVDSPEWQIWTADTREKLPCLTLSPSSSQKLKQAQKLLMPWKFLHVVSKPFLSQNAVVVVLTLGVCRYIWHNMICKTIFRYRVVRLLEKWGKGAFWRYQNNVSHLEMLLARPSILCIYCHM